MADDVQTTTMAGKPSIPPLGILGIVKESLQIPAKKGKFMVSITFLILVTFFLIAVVRRQIITPLEMGLASKMANLTKYDQDSQQAEGIFDQIKQEIGELVLFAAVSIIIKCAVLFFSLIATVYLSAMAYSGKHLTPEELILRIRRSWKSPLITALLVFLLSAGYGLVAIVLRDLIASATSGILLAVLSLLVSLPASLLYAYVTTICMLGFVISVVEEDCYAVKAIGKAGEIIKGRKLQGFLLMLLLYIMAFAIYLAYLCTINIIIKGETVGRWVATIIMACLECLVLILMFVVNTVFYHECMKAIDDEDGNSTDRANYALVPTTED